MNTCAAELKGARVMTTYLNRIYTVEEVDFSKSAKTTFEWHKNNSARQISLEDYVQEQYNHRIPQQKHACVLVCSNKRRGRSARQRDAEAEAEGEEGVRRRSKYVLILPEACNLVGVPCDKLSNHGFMKDLASMTRKSATARMKMVSV